MAFPYNKKYVARFGLDGYYIILHLECNKNFAE